MACARVLDRHSRRAHPHRGHRYARAFALLARDSQLQPYAYLDDAPLEERRARAVQMRRTLPADYAEGAGALDPEAIAQVAAEAWPPMRDADELHEALLGLGVLPASGEPAPSWFERAAGRRPRRHADASAAALLGGRRAPGSGAPRLSAVPSSIREIAAPAGGARRPRIARACAAEILRGWFECSGPLRASGPGARSGHAARPGGPGAGATGSRRPDPARPFHAGGPDVPAPAPDRMVPPPPAGPHPPPDHRPAAARNRAGHHGRVLRLPEPLAAPLRRAASCTAWMARSRSSGSCRAASSRRPRGKPRSCRGAWRATSPSTWTSSALRAK